jgi:hypothetical protein
MQICNRGSVNILDMAFSETNIQLPETNTQKGITNILTDRRNYPKE